METNKTLADPNSNRSKKRAAVAAHNEAMKARNEAVDLPPTAEQKAEMERLSVKLFRSSSRAATLLKRGSAELVTEEVTEYVPEEKDEAGNVIKAEEMVKHQQAVKYMNAEKSTISKVKRYTPESLISELQAREKKYDEFMELIRKQQEEQKKKREDALLAEQVQNAAGGNAL